MHACNTQTHTYTTHKRESLWQQCKTQLLPPNKLVPFKCSNLAGSWDRNRVSWAEATEPKFHYDPNNAKRDKNSQEFASPTAARSPIYSWVGWSNVRTVSCSKIQQQYHEASNLELCDYLVSALTTWLFWQARKYHAHTYTHYTNVCVCVYVHICMCVHAGHKSQIYTVK